MAHRPARRPETSIGGCAIANLRRAQLRARAPRALFYAFVTIWILQRLADPRPERVERVP